MNGERFALNNPSSLLWLWVPVVILLAQIGVELFVPEAYLPEMHSEGGPIETIQFLFIALASVLALVLVFRADGIFLKGWFSLFLAGSVYIAGEEISWGQHIFEWYTPEFWSQINDQNETNLHNTSSWLDQKPRLLLFIGIVAGGLLVPLLRRYRPSLLPKKFAVLYPQGYMWVTALGVLIPYLAQEIAETVFGASLSHRVSEVQELYMYFFILLYMYGFVKFGFPKVQVMKKGGKPI